MKSARNEAQPYLRLDTDGRVIVVNSAGMGVLAISKGVMIPADSFDTKANRITEVEIRPNGVSISAIAVPIRGGVIVLPLPMAHDSHAWMMYLAAISMDGWSRPLVDAMVAAIENLGPNQQALLQSFDALQLIPNNMRIVASRLEPSGGPISVISENYKISSMALSQRLQNYVGAGGVCCQAVEMMSRLRLLMGASAQLGLLKAQFDSGEWAEEEMWLNSAVDCLHEEIPLKIKKVRSATAALNASSAEVRRMMLGLDTIRVLGRVESSRMRDSGGLSSTIDQLDTFHSEIQKRVEHIMSLAEAVSLSARYATSTKRGAGAP